MTVRDLQLPIRTARLTLRPFAAGDFAAYADYQGRDDVYRYLYAHAPAGEALAQQFRRVLDAPLAHDGDILKLAVVRDEDGAVLGEVLLKLASQAALQGEVGYVFHPAYAGKGYATEAVKAMIDFGFARLGFHRIFARLDAANAGSVGVVERLGMRREAHLVQNDRFNGVWGDEYVYAVLATEWAARGQ
ncbi:GNAT family N-acetyltransferase [Massilia sp. HP4]|uniref:GNAT family N-acetyltransferase n=1 Tax=Massilia sp. HP4 TaxID=2562316 RepID=UPI0010BFF8FF|nr:GNAT family protein [Massilia sp. HP4]